jgi:hypothetical protein
MTRGVYGFAGDGDCGGGNESVAFNLYEMRLPLKKTSALFPI